MHLRLVLHGQQQERQDGEENGAAHGREVYPTSEGTQFGSLAYRGLPKWVTASTRLMVFPLILLTERERRHSGY
jgi:hypothetical protein